MDKIRKIVCVCRMLAAWVCVMPAVFAAAPESSATTGTTELSPVGARIEQILKPMDWGDGELAAIVADADSPVALFSRQGDKPMQPGALMQLFTAAAALDQLGPEYKFTTEVSYSGEIDRKAKTLTGSIIIRSNGDPSISSRYMSEAAVVKILDGWVDKIKDLRIGKITGAIAGDARAFDNEWFAPGWPMQRIGAADLPSISAVNFNNDALDIFWESNRHAGRTPACRIFPDVGEYLFIANHAVLVEKARRERVYHRVEHGNLISIDGDLPIKTEAHDRAAIEDPGRFFAEALRRRLIVNKVEVAGKGYSTATLADDAMPTQTTVVDKRLSPPLSIILEHMLRENSALEAEVTFKAMGMKLDDRPGNFESGRRALANYLEQRLRLPRAPTRIFDGSGRSTLDNVTAANVIDLMRRAGRLNTGPVFAGLLPRAGEGVLAGRFEKKAPLRAIASSADGVEAIAGWTEPTPGRRVLFVFIVNGSHTPVSILRRQFDTLVLDLTHLGEAGHP